MTTKIIYGKTSDGLHAALIDNQAYCMKQSRNGNYIAISGGFGPVNLSKLSERDFYMHLGNVKDIEEFNAEMVDLAQNEDELKAFNRHQMASSTNTPWGKSQGATVYSENGLYKHSTTGHGGMKVYTSLNKQIPEPYRHKDGWYEEDNDIAKVIVSLPQYFTQREIRQATENVINHYPNEYEQVTGNKLLPGQSRKRDEEIFNKEHANDYIVCSARTEEDEHGNKYVQTHAVLGNDRTNETRSFKVPVEEYSNRTPFGFVIDLNRHEEILPEVKTGLREANEEELNHLFGVK